MGTNNIPIDNSNEPYILKQTDSTPERRFTTPWFRGNGGFFRVYLTIVGPELEEPDSYLPLGHCQAQAIVKTINDIIELLEEKPR